jgi:transposase-like protein
MSPCRGFYSQVAGLDRNAWQVWAGISKKYSKQNPTLSSWIEENIPEGMTVFQMPKKHWVRLRTSNMAERQMKEIKTKNKSCWDLPECKIT